MSGPIRATARRLAQFPMWHSRYHCKGNKAVEDWAKRRENLHLEFEPNAKWTFRAIFWGMVIPFGIYTLCVEEQERNDKAITGRSRVYWGGSESSY